MKYKKICPTCNGSGIQGRIYPRGEDDHLAGHMCKKCMGKGFIMDDYNPFEGRKIEKIDKVLLPLPFDANPLISSIPIISIDYQNFCQDNLSPETVKINREGKKCICPIEFEGYCNPETRRKGENMPCFVKNLGKWDVHACPYCYSQWMKNRSTRRTEMILYCWKLYEI